MEKLAHSKNTPGTDAAFDLLAQVAVDPDSEERYPDGTVLVPADSADASGLISAAVTAQKPIAIVFPDGSDVVARPPAATGLALLALDCLFWLTDRIAPKRDQPTFVPREWVTEFHAARANQAQLVS